MRSDIQAVIITMTGLLCHINRVYPVGAKGDELLDAYQANIMSICFVVAVSILLSMKQLWPTFLKSPSRPIMYLYLTLVSAFTVSVSLRMIWLPLTMSLSKSNLWMATKIKTTRMLKKSFLFNTVNLLESRIFHKAEMAVLAFTFLGYALKASGICGEFTGSRNRKPCDLQIVHRYIKKSSGPLVSCGSENSLLYIAKKTTQNSSKNIDVLS